MKDTLMICVEHPVHGGPIGGSSLFTTTPEVSDGCRPFVSVIYQPTCLFMCVCVCVSLCIEMSIKEPPPSMSALPKIPPPQQLFEEI